MVCDDDMRNAWELLRHRDLSQEECDQLERFFCQLIVIQVQSIHQSERLDVAGTPTAQLRVRVFPQRLAH